MPTNIDIWRINLENPAGIEAQLLMAPKFRKEELANYSNLLPQQKSAVLVFIYFDSFSNKPYIVLTLRSSKLRKHGGQVSFPGGKMDKEDDDIKATALREAEEEIGLIRNNIEIIGYLSPIIIPITGFKVFPVVGFSYNKPDFKINTDEVEKLLLIPVDDLLSLENIKRKLFAKASSKYGIQAPYFHVENAEIWGATAMILAELIMTLFPNSNFAKHTHSFY